jgi:AraC-like DNA-binding protein
MGKPQRASRGERLGIGLGASHAFLSQEVAATFQHLEVGATLRDETGWYAVHWTAESVQDFERVHGLEPERDAYNDASVDRVRRKGKTLLAAHAGFSDYWVPVWSGATVGAVLVTGPFATTRPTSAQILERWQRLTGRTGDPADAELSHYTATTLATLTLEGDLLAAYLRLLECYASLLGGRGDARALSVEAGVLRARLGEVRAAERMWQAARTMVDEQTEHRWVTPQAANNLHALGAPRLPEHALVGFSVSTSDNAHPVDTMVRRDALQRACVALARAEGAVAGKVGEHGVVLLICSDRSPARTAARIAHFAGEASRLARREFGLRCHFGASDPSAPASLNVRFDQALRAADRALCHGVPTVHAEREPSLAGSPVRLLRRSLGEILPGEPAALVARFERYAEAVRVHSGYRLDAMRAGLDAGFERAAEALLGAGLLDERTYTETCAALDRTAGGAATTGDLFAAYRRAMLYLSDTSSHPHRGAHDQGLRRAVLHVRRYFAAPLRLSHVARVAGLSPSYFAQRWRAKEGMTFRQYVNVLRIERAKQLLRGTELGIERVAQLSGFRLRPYFFRVFKKTVGVTPDAYRHGRAEVDW